MECPKIKIKSFFGGWREVTKEQAKEWVLYMKKSTTLMSGEKLDDYLNSRLDGITVEKLLTIKE